MSTSHKPKKVKQSEASQKIDPMQLELLEMFRSRKFDKQVLLNIKKMIADYYFDKADQAMDELFEDKNWDVQEKIKEWSKKRRPSHFGSAKGKIKISEDFDNPLDDFENYQ